MPKGSPRGMRVSAVYWSSRNCPLGFADLSDLSTKMGLHGGHGYGVRNRLRSSLRSNAHRELALTQLNSPLLISFDSAIPTFKRGSHVISFDGSLSSQWVCQLEGKRNPFLFRLEITLHLIFDPMRIVKQEGLDI